jgi:alpha-tubulin suppressor-like RCC1 family protein
VAYCWGDNYFGELGDGSTSKSSTPVAVAGGLTFVSVPTGGAQSCGLTTTGLAYCWGLNVARVPIALAGELTLVALSAGGDHSCGVTTVGAAYCWGFNDSGQLGNGSTTQSNTPVAVAGGLAFATVSAGSGHSCGVTTAGAAYCWGSNGSGELGNGSTTQSSTPVRVAGGLSFATVSAGGGYSCGVTTAGAAYCWGYNYTGELGNGSTTNSSAPTAVAGGLTFATVSAAEVATFVDIGDMDFVPVHHSCGVTTAGAAYCWGHNQSGELGNGLTTDSSTPVPVAGGLTFASVSAAARGRLSGGYSCGLTSTHAAYCWGGNALGQLGNGTTTESTVPTRVLLP